MRVTSAVTALVGAAAAYEQAVYYNDFESTRSLSSYCKSGEGIDIIILAFLDNFGGGNYPNGDVGGCYIDKNGNASGCQGVIDGINACHAAGKKVFISIGGGGSSYKLTSSGDAKGVAYSLWNSFARPSATSNSPRPFGDAYVDGWDIDLESDNGSQQYLGTLINTLRGYFSKDAGHTYYISGAPQCPLPEYNMGNSMMQAKYDYLWIQFYNNNCAAAEIVRPGGQTDSNIGNSNFNFGDWPGYLSKGASSGAKLLVGIPGSTKGATNYDYIRTKEIPTVLNKAKSVAGFSGIMLWDAGNSDTVSVNGCNYAQNIRKALDTGNPC